MFSNYVNFIKLDYNFGQFTSPAALMMRTEQKYKKYLRRKFGETPSKKRTTLPPYNAHLVNKFFKERQNTRDGNMIKILGKMKNTPRQLTERANYTTGALD